ncbi:anthranilate synthase component I [Natrarchaeobaculum sulfurireducens]|uniref:Anthranilate synthase component 1 n=1 Tax=Natrarchaeobaculum sulfurireducens TaxID=2044521 RepID=A0A346PES0_9EURY|nr:anthranilate synthase component I [Natrarchaeobaculum sulfurireducens]AXR78015.1 Anthranilate/para-aminobenzoate synthase component I [Natrarchaeobaculum sulfurireducens]
MTGTEPPSSESSELVSLDLDRAAFREHASSPSDRPVVVRTVATLDVETTPLSAYAALTGRSPSSDRERSPYAFLLESAEKTASSDPDGAFRPSSATAERHARFSYVGYDPDAVVTVGPDGTDVEALSADTPQDLLEVDTDGDTVDALRAAMPDVRLANFPDHDRQHLEGGLVGFLAYDAVYDLWLEEVGLERPESRFPDAQFVLTTKTLAFDEHDGTVSLVCTPILEDGDDPNAVYDELEAEAAAVAGTLYGAEPPETGGFVREDEVAGPKDEYEAHVRRAKEHVLDGDIYQGVISRTRELYGDVDPLGFYESMREVNPSPYMYLLEHDDLTVVGASPETLISVRGREVMSNPIAGTCNRGTSPVEDRRLAGEMLADEKERAEHTMLVDLARNDVRRVSEPGSVRVEEFMNVLKYSHVQHIESTVTGTLAADTDAAEPRSAARETSSPDAFDATRASFPAGTLSGAPKIRAMEIIDDLETTPRGLYGGGVGYYSWTGDADFAIVIRTATIADDGDNQRITVQAGAGLVADSDPTAEYEETEKKMGGVLSALEAIETSADSTVEESADTLESPEVSR